MFELSNQPFDTDALRQQLVSPAAGAFVSFEGWVRDHNNGKSVRSLEYQAYERLALKEGQRVVAEALRASGALRAHCVHRTGHLELGELAVWVGVSSAHREEAFACCRRIIDEIKIRLPIWKKEFYVDGDSGWVNCERCSEAAASVSLTG